MPENVKDHFAICMINDNRSSANGIFGLDFAKAQSYLPADEEITVDNCRIITFSSWRKYIHFIEKDHLNINRSFTEDEEYCSRTNERILAKIPEGADIKEYIKPISDLGYGKVLEMEFVTSISACYPNQVSKDDIKDSIARIFSKLDIHRFKNMISNNKNRQGHASAEYLGMILDYETDIWNSFDSFDDLIDMIKFDDIYAISNQFIYTIPIAFPSIKVRKGVTSTLPPFTREGDLEKIYKDPGQNLDNSSTSKQFRIAMDRILYNDKLEVVSGLKENSRGNYKYHSRYLRFKSTVASTPMEKLVYEETKDDSSIVDNEWLPMIVKSYVMSNSASTFANCKGLACSVIYGLNKIFPDSLGFSNEDDDVKLAILNSPKSDVKMSPNEVFKKIENDIKNSIILTKELENLLAFLKSCFREEDLETQFELKDFINKIMAITIETNPLEILTFESLFSNNEEDSYHMGIMPYLQKIINLAKKQLGK